MKTKKRLTPFAPVELRRFIMPFTLASVLILASIVAEDILMHKTPDVALIAFGILGTFYLAGNNYLIIRFISHRNNYHFVNALISGVALGILALILPANLREVFHILAILGSLVIATISGRYYAYITLLSIVAVSLPHNLPGLVNTEAFLEYFMPILVSIVTMEVILRIKNTTQQHIHRLETINRVSRKIMQSLDTEQTISLLDTTIRDTLEADTYFIGVLHNDEIELTLFYDEGEYFNGTCVPIKGTLSGWVIKNQKELFLPDMREEVQLDGIEHFVKGKDRTSLSWIGVPLKAPNVTGVMALASYNPDAFDRADLELLSSLAQHVTLALDNTIRHAQVEEQARLDSLTGVYNHGYFLKRLAELSTEALETNQPLSLIMLDIDYFKQYNDTFGHLVGDQILTALCYAIKHNIKQADAVGRWGGEEFIISLPGATGIQATQIAKRISLTMASVRVQDRDQQTVPIPTVSQGIAVFPAEANEIYHLIDIADKRLYVAKGRGRNQVEPPLEYWN